MNDDIARSIIIDYEKGRVGLHKYVEAIEYCAEKYPHMTMTDLIAWAKKEANNESKNDK